MRAHKLTIEGRWGYCVCGWSTGPVGIGEFDGMQQEIHGDYVAHRRQRTDEDDREHRNRPTDVSWSFDDELDTWDDDVEDVLW